jgi:GNAT superfamily N-acetyltransferase
MRSWPLRYRRVLLLERWLDDPIAPITPRVPVIFSALAPTHIDEYLRFRRKALRTRIEERIARGDECFVARHDGRIVCVSWAARGEHFMRPLHYRYAIGSSEVYLYDGFTVPTFRGRAIAPALGVHVLERLAGAGVTRVTIAVEPGNVANLRARAKTGFRVCGRIDFLRLGRHVWHRRRERRARMPV